MNHDSNASNPEPVRSAHEVTSEPVEISTRVRFTTISWGLILLSFGVAVMTLSAGYAFDIQLALIAVLAVAGLTLLGGSIVRSIRK